MADPQVEQPSPDQPLQRAPARGLVVDPEERPLPVLSSEPPPRKNPSLKRKVAVAKKACIILVAALFGLILLAFIAETPDSPVRTPTQSPSMRG